MRDGLNYRNLLVLLGILVTSLGLLYFATEFMDRLSDWGILLSLLLLTIIFVSLGIHFERQDPAHAETRWLRIPVALYLLGLVAGLTAVIKFLSMDEVDRVVKVIATLALGLGLILFAAKRFGRGPAPPAAPPPQI